MKTPNGIVLFCPVCGKAPKIFNEACSYHVARCKPLFGKPHVIVMTEYASDLIQAWNNAVKQIVEYDKMADAKQED